MKKKMKNNLKLGIGKIRRFYLSTFRKKQVKKMLQKRKGQCNQCGACCQLLVKCPFLYRKDNLFCCKIYGKVRPINCIVFPLNKKDIKERDYINTDIACGYYFDEKS
ncbi:MAG: hypothetical protein ACQESP_06005 [Candidatus Muiribacteriota bacterium]